VSHAAPAHHFGDKAGLLTAIAADGYDLLAAALREAFARTGSFLEVGVAYVTFAIDHTSHFEVMFRPELYRPDDPAVAAARRGSQSALRDPLAGVVDTKDDTELTASALAAWSIVHGLATLLLTDNVPPDLASQPQALARRVAAQLFTSGSVGSVVAPVAR
jgi:AcrR family transcriptional regulator